MTEAPAVASTWLFCASRIAVEYCIYPPLFSAQFAAGSDMVPDNNNIANAQTVTINQFDVTRGNA